MNINTEYLNSPGCKKIFLVALILLIAGGNVIYHTFYYNRYEIAENLETVDWLPQSAKNISYYKRDQSYVYEFSIGETDFLLWAREKDLKYEKIEEGPIAVARYSFFIDAPNDDHENLSETESYQEWMSQNKVFINNGYFFEGDPDANENNNSGSYDAEAGKVYYKSL